jgi:hypothetical protein
MWLQFVGGKQDLYVEDVQAFGRFECDKGLSGSRSAAITAQQSCSIATGRNLTGRDGMSKIRSRRSARLQGNFARAETFPVRYGGANCEAGLISSKNTKEKVRCASRRLLR